MDLLDTYQKSVLIIEYLKKHRGGGVASPGVNIDDIARALRIKRSDIYPVIDYLIKEGHITRPDGRNDSLFRLTYKALTLL